MSKLPAGEAVTHCLGRHLIDIPVGATISADFIVGGAAVKARNGVSEKDFRRVVGEREAELKSLPYDLEGARFKERLDLSADRVFLASWLNETSKWLYLVELYSLMQDQSVMHHFSAEASAKQHAISRDYTKDLANSLVYRTNHDIPQRAGFCIDWGLVARSVLNKEETTATIRIPGLPSVGIHYMAYVTGTPDKPLLRRLPLNVSAHDEVSGSTKKLRRGDRNIGPIKGQELLLRGEGGGKRSYEFLWESQGEEDSIEHPFLSLEMTTTESTDEEGEIIDAPFANDAEALALWDLILGSLRLRPGAIDPTAASE